ncbi:MAG: CPBP family intramembrane metalloprotease [Prochloraceae cyanobacterium]|nr:CPBP family intramembrane metalloprotease [Prochloraceae cyanobacterium]
MTKKYLKLAQLGKNQGWRYLVSITLILFFWMFLGVIPYSVLLSIVLFDNNPNTTFDEATQRIEGIDVIWSYITLNFAFVFFALGLYLAVLLIHKRSLLTLITPRDRINWKRIIEGFSIYFVLLLAIDLINYLVFNASYQLTFEAEKFLVFLPIALILTPIQTTIEELFFRGYLIQLFGLKFNSFLSILFSSLIFCLVHLLNPEVLSSQSSLIFWIGIYLTMGLFFAIITIKDNGLELAIATHAVNNLYVALLVNYKFSALPSPSIFLTEKLNPKTTLVALLIINAIAYFIFFRKKNQIEDDITNKNNASL